MSTSKGPPALSDATSSSNNSSFKANLICQDLILMKQASAKIKEYVKNLDMQINKACETLKELQTRESCEMELDELKKFVNKLKSHIPSPPKLHSSDSHTHQNRWPNVNKASKEMIDNLYEEQKFEHTSKEMMHNLYKEQKFEHTIDSESLLKAFLGLPTEGRMYLMCFFWFPPPAIVKKSVMIYLWMAHPYSIQNIDEDDANKIFDEFVAQGFIKPVKQNSRLVPDSCMMSLSLCSSLSGELREQNYCNLINISNQFCAVGFPDHADIYECLINVDAAIIDGWPDQFEKIQDLKILYLGRWNTSSTHHIELADTKIFNRLKIWNHLTFLSLRGISLITELPSFIKECISLKILDLRACHNLEVIPNWIGSLKTLTHLDMSECYLLESMPKSLANLPILEVLKGFLVSASKHNNVACTLGDLSELPNLRKLNITTFVENIPWERKRPNENPFPSLQKLTISWGGSQIRAHQEATGAASHSQPPFYILQKLVLQGFPGTSLPSWVRPDNLEALKTLSIIGGQLSDPPSTQQPWKGVQILHLKYLSNLDMGWGDLKILFPNVILLHKVECPKLTNFPCDIRGVWMDN